MLLAGGGCGGGLGLRGWMAGGQFDLLLGLEAVSAEDAFDVGGFGGVTGSAKLGGPVFEMRELFAPTGEVELDVGLSMAML